MVFFSLLGIAAVGITGCINTTSFNNLASGESQSPIIEDEVNTGIPDQDISTSKVFLSLFKDYEPVDIKNINLQIIKELNTNIIEINSEFVKNNSKNNEQSQKNEIAPLSEEIDPPSQVQDLNSMEIQIFNMLNHIRVQNGFQKLNLNQVISNIANLRSTDMINRNYFSHYTPEGKHTTDILTENGVMYASSGEILFRATPPSYGPPEVIMNAWLGSNLHREIIFNPHFNQVGISIIDGGNKRIVSVIFLN